MKNKTKVIKAMLANIDLDEHHPRYDYIFDQVYAASDVLSRLELEQLIDELNEL